MKTMMVMDMLLVCFGLTVMMKIYLALVSFNGTVQLVTALPAEFLYVAASPFVF